MTKETLRAVRRHHVARIKTNRQNYWGLGSMGSARIKGKIARTPKQCSCLMCGNPRRGNGHLTLQELRHKALSQSYESDLDAIATQGLHGYEYELYI